MYNFFMPIMYLISIKITKVNFFVGLPYGLAVGFTSGLGEFLFFSLSYKKKYDQKNKLKKKLYLIFLKN